MSNCFVCASFKIVIQRCGMYIFCFIFFFFTFSTITEHTLREISHVAALRHNGNFPIIESVGNHCIITKKKVIHNVKKNKKQEYQNVKHLFWKRRKEATTNCHMKCDEYVPHVPLKLRRDMVTVFFFVVCAPMSGGQKMKSLKNR